MKCQNKLHHFLWG